MASRSGSGESHFRFCIFGGCLYSPLNLFENRNPEIRAGISLTGAGMHGGVLKEEPLVHPQNKGGVELFKVQTLWLDAGYKFKGDPTADARRSSTFVDVRDQRCTVGNKEIFELTSDGDSFFRFTDDELKTFLAVRCPGLHLNW